MAFSSSTSLLLLLISSLLISAHFNNVHIVAQTTRPPTVSGLSYTFHNSRCPDLKSIVRNRLREVFQNDVEQAAGLLRLHFHDCFVQGCDSSVLLVGSASGPGEQAAPPNLTLRQQAFRIIDDLRRRVHSRCGRIVSCSDILALAARDSVFLTGGPDYDIPLGRRDGLNFATRADTIANLPPPTSNTSALLTSLATKNFNATDVVALSGGHTIGIGHCPSFDERIYPNIDPTMDQTFARNLRITCPTPDSNNRTFLDIRSPNVFDNRYYVDLMNRQGLFTSDQDLYTDRRTRGIVTDFAINQTLFFEKFVYAMIKMSQLNVLTGNQGEIRSNCSLRNAAAMGRSSSSLLGSVVEEAAEIGLSMF
ncbi:hypothetical protein M9H77_31759 [Catharanthus roseus]|uniref:Uncharacterized protein n=2 Tax=Catharanthus roseus TaxID=4058 RepID=A0ACC0A3P3_CATRO|nr:hypothetical protein M9H77_31759 [Catharanthus roseus]CAJ84723.1 peroxidase 1 [Catharanthus roseus]